MQQEEWISAGELFRAVRGTVAPLGEIEKRARLGLLDSRAELRVETVKGKVERFADEPVPAWVWTNLEDRRSSMIMDWQRGGISASSITDDRHRSLSLEVIGLQFKPGQVGNILAPWLKGPLAPTVIEGGVVPFPSKPVEMGEVDGPVLVAVAPERPPRKSPYMGLLEAVAWVGSRDHRLSDATHWHLWEQDKGGSFWTWQLLAADLINEFNVAIVEAEEELFHALANDELEAVGRYEGASSFSKMEPLLWINVRLGFEKKRDTIRPEVRQIFGEVAWENISVSRSAVIAKWPAQEPQGTGLALVVSNDRAAGADETAAQAAPSKAKRERKQRPYAERLQFVFKEHHDSIADMTEIGRHNFILKFFGQYEGDPPRSARTTQAHWEKHLERRAAQIR